MKIKFLLILALTATLSFAMVACGTTQKKNQNQATDELEELWDEEFDGEDFGLEGEEGDAAEEDDIKGEVALNGDPNKADRIVISKESMTLNLFDSDGALIFSFPVAVGKNYGNKQQVGDMKTPEGDFTIQQIQDASAWKHNFGDGKGEIAGAYGNWFIRLKTPGHTGIGIHGTHAPESIGTRATEGCIRLNNADLDKLKPLVRVGMKVTIESSVKDMEADGRSEENGLNKATLAEEDAASDNLFKDIADNKKEIGSIDVEKIAEVDDNAVDHVIAAGDNFSTLAKKYETTSDRIQKLNPDVDPKKIQIGQKIRVKGNKPLVKEEKKAEVKAEEKAEEKKVEEKKAEETSTSNDEAVYHTVVSGETMGHIAYKYEGATQKSIEALNPDIDPTKLQIGQKIRVK
ncbi:MAG: LysM peptidoglycan-binding domain-containing protein [Alistipes sp.]|nr:LysM peptidoglycan-binding domain-containing protein [Alistipes sp.]